VFDSVLDLSSITLDLAGNHSFHSRDSDWYEDVSNVLHQLIDDHRKSVSGVLRVDLGDELEIALRYESFGSGGIDVYNLFGLDELILFAYYRSLPLPGTAIDVGANVGLHTIVLRLLGWSVRSLEPDPVHSASLRANLALNQIESGVEIIDAALAATSGRRDFVRVKGNTTGSHLAGSKSAAYGDLDTFEVRTVAARDVIGGCALMKLDAEGSEVEIVRAIGDLADLRVMMEVGSPSNARSLFEFCQATEVTMYSQKRGWNPVASFEDVPCSYREGSLYLCGDALSPWRGNC
jgi:FkbM family methyltransferase